MRPSVFISALMAVIVGFGSSFALVLAAVEALGASQVQTVSWLAGLGLGITINATVLSWAFKCPLQQPGQRLQPLYWRHLSAWGWNRRWQAF